MLLVVYAFLSLMYFKVMPEYLFREGISIVGAVMMSLTSTACMFWVTLAVNKVGLQVIATDDRRLLLQTFRPFAIGTAFAVGLGYFCAVGFSVQFYKRVLDYGDEVYWFLFMLASPPLVHFVIIVFDILRVSRFMRDNNDDRTKR